MSNLQSRSTQWAAVAVLTLFATAAFPVSAAGDETPETEPLGPESRLFHLHISKDFECSIAAAEMAETPYEGASHYATNVLDDACAKTDWDTDGSASIFTTSKQIDVHLIPLFDQPVELVEGDPINVTLWIWTENVGRVSPHVTLKTTSWSSHLDSGSRIAPAHIEAAPGGLVWQRFDLDLGPAPAAFEAGAATLSIGLENGAEDLRRASAYRSGIGAAGDHKSSILLPLDEQVDEPGDPVVVWPPALESATVRPGVQHVTRGAQCTTNFVFRDLDTQKLYMGTAAHCVDNVGVGGNSTIRAVGSGTSITAKVAFSSWENASVGSDFALLEIPPDREQDVHPAVLHFGGPTHLANMTTVGTLDKVITYGNSGLRPYNTPLDPHEGYVTGKNKWYTSVYTVTPAIFGDSGSGIMTKDGGAIGAASTIEFAPVPGRNHFGNIPPVIEWMNDNGWNLELQTWELLEPGVLPAPMG